MKFIITTIGTAGDVYPFIGIAKELKQRGHSVHFITSSAYQEEVEQQGIDFHSVLSKADHEKSLKDPNLSRLISFVSAFSRHYVLPTLKPAYELIADLYEEGNTVIISHLMFLASRIAQDKFNIPLATIQLAPVGMLSVENPLRYPGVTLPASLPNWIKSSFLSLFLSALDRMLALPEINAFRASIHLAPVRQLFKKWVLSPTKIIGLFPKWFGTQPSDWPEQLQLTSFPLYNPSNTAEIPDTLCAFLNRPNRVVIFTAGSGMAHAHQFFRESILACKKMACDGIFLTPYAEQIPSTLPDYIYHLDYLPLDMLLPHASAIVHFGGIGTAAQAMAYGTPQLIVPNIGDQYDNALRLRQCGVALELSQQEYKAKKVTAALNELLTSPTIEFNCHRHARLLKQQQGIPEVCNILEKTPELEPESNSDFSVCGFESAGAV